MLACNSIDFTTKDRQAQANSETSAYSSYHERVKTEWSSSHIDQQHPKQSSEPQLSTEARTSKHTNPVFGEGRLQACGGETELPLRRAAANAGGQDE